MRDRLSVQKTASVLRMCIELYIRIILRTYGYVDMYVQHPTAYILRTCLILPVTSYKINDTPYHCFNIFLIFSFLFVARFTLLQDRQDRCWKRFS